MPKQNVGVALTPAPQDYLKAIYRLTESGEGRAGTKDIAARLGVSQPSVSAMLNRLASDGLAHYVQYQGASLTATGRTAALRVIRRHRLLELYLTTFLGLGWEEVHEEAEMLEHVLSARLETAMDKALGHPKTDPHGDPIPSRDGTLEVTDLRTLWSADAGQAARVTRVSDSDPELLRHLRVLGIVPGAEVSEVRRQSGGTVRLKVKGRSQLVGREAAEKVYING